tara:strand:- start:243 stop:437 length:195 start_codon:yes stop_codon:yes gene_type:complete
VSPDSDSIIHLKKPERPFSIIPNLKSELCIITVEDGRMPRSVIFLDKSFNEVECKDISIAIKRS